MTPEMWLLPSTEQHVAGLQRMAQRLGIARRERLVAAHRLVQIAGDQPPDAIEHPAHGRLPSRAARFRRVFICGILCEVRCNLVHAAACGT